MKKTILFFIAIFYGTFLAGQSGGDGLTPGTAFYGTITTPTTWTYSYNSGTIYVGQTGGNEDLTIGTGGSLTIEAGVTIKFCTTASDLKITGTGLLSAIGTGSSLITFTRNIQSTWGHISFEASTGNSIINYCVIEYGYKNGSSIEGYGGGIHANTDNLSISNCIIRNNYALWGGGIFVNQYRYPSISNCYVSNNQSSHGGGGFYFWDRAKSVISNCIFDSNHCLEPSVSFYTGGGLAAQSGTSLKILNCTFVNNTSTQPTGKSIMLYSSLGDLVLNCIVWGNTGNQFYLTGTNTIQYTAVVVSAPAGTGNFVLSINNTDPAGPNFNNPAIADWSINFVSPCRDQGTTPSPAIPNDYAGNPRIGPYDIGAYEVQYSRWAGSGTAWGTASNWLPGLIPGSSSDIVIPSGLANYPTDEPGPAVTIGSGKYLILEPGAKATVTTISNSGTLWLMSDATDIFSLKVDNYSNNGGTGTEKIELYLSGKESLNVNNWHYISSPVSSLPVSTFSPVPTQDLAQFVESLPSGGYYDGWIAYDGWNYTLGTVPPNPPYTFSSLAVGQGYNYFHRVNYKYTFTGNLNTSSVSKTLSYTGNPGLAIRGFNLMGNPFSSGLNWDVIANGIYPSNTSKAIHFTQNNIQCDYVNGIGTNGATGIIPPMQGFFIKTNNTPDINLTIPLSARVHNSIHPRYKGETIIPLVRLSITEGVISDETVVRFDDLAKSYFDTDFDAAKMFVSESKTTIYSSLDGIKYSINGLPFPATLVEIPVVVTFITSGEHTIATPQLQGLTDYFVTLTDKVTGFTADLKTTPNVVFSANAGSYPDRFILKISNLTTGTEDLPVSEKGFSIYYANDMINIQTGSEEWEGKSGSVRILDLSGKTVTEKQNAEFRKNSITQVQSPSTTGLYFVEIRAGLKRYVGKVVIR